MCTIVRSIPIRHYLRLIRPPITILGAFALFVTHVQCGNCRIFLSFRFYVKSILGDSRCAKYANLTNLEALNFVNLINLSLQKVQKYIKIKI